MSEIYLLFYQAALQPFIALNNLLQREDPIISIMQTQFTTFLKKLFGRFVRIDAIQSAEADLTELDYANSAKQLASLYIYI